MVAGEGRETEQEADPVGLVGQGRVSDFFQEGWETIGRIRAGEKTQFNVHVAKTTLTLVWGTVWCDGVGAGAGRPVRKSLQ